VQDENTEIQKNQSIWNGLFARSMHLRDSLGESPNIQYLIDHLQTIEELLKDSCEPVEEFELYVFYHFMQSMRENLVAIEKSQPSRS
jgi:hypothetical protein